MNLGSQSNAHAMFKRTGAEVQRSYNTRQYGKFMATYILTQICWRKDNKRGWKSIWTFFIGGVWAVREKKKKKLLLGNILAISMIHSSHCKLCTECTQSYRISLCIMNGQHLTASDHQEMLNRKAWRCQGLRIQLMLMKIWMEGTQQRISSTAIFPNGWQSWYEDLSLMRFISLLADTTPLITTGKFIW